MDMRDRINHYSNKLAIYKKTLLTLITLSDKVL